MFTAFSGSHQDAINKGMQALQERNESQYWEVPYLPIDPADIGRKYEPIVRINSQSGKGGVAFVMDTFYGFKLPKGMHKEFADVIQKISEKQGEVAPEQIMDEFTQELSGAQGADAFPQVPDHRYGDRQTASLLLWPRLPIRITVWKSTFDGVGNGPH